jgi:hypothetical protein
MSSHDSENNLVECGYQAVKFRIVLWFSLVVAVITTIIGWLIFRSYGLSPADGGVFLPVEERLMMGGFVALLGLVFAGGMLLYASVYVVRIGRAGDTLVVSTLGISSDRPHQLKVADVGELNYHAGRMFTPRGQNVNAPWLTMPVRGRLIPYVIDAQSEHLDRPGLKALEKNAWRARLKEKAARSEP